MDKDTKWALVHHGGDPVRSEPFPPWPDYDEREIEAVSAVLKSGKLARQSGAQVSQFEQDFAEKFNAKRGVIFGESKYLGWGYIVKIKPPLVISENQVQGTLEVFEEILNELS